MTKADSHYCELNGCLSEGTVPIFDDNGAKRWVCFIHHHEIFGDEHSAAASDELEIKQLRDDFAKVIKKANELGKKNYILDFDVIKYNQTTDGTYHSVVHGEIKITKEF